MQFINYMQLQKTKDDLLTVDRVIDDLTLFDDDLMSMVFDDNIEAAELLLRIILEQEDLRVLSVVGQRELENPIVDGRNIRLDIFAQDSNNRYFDIEVQKSTKGAHPRRARFHGSMLDVRMLKEKQPFKELRDSYVIFITEKDTVGEGLPLYHICRKIEETGELFNDGSHIIYVNGSYKGDDPVGKLVHDLGCKKSDEMYYNQLSNGVRHFKKTGGGSKRMSELLERYLEQGRLETLFVTIKNLMQSMNLSAEQAMEAMKLSQEDRAVLSKKL